MFSPSLPAHADRVPRSGYRGSDFVPWHSLVHLLTGRARQLCPGVSDFDFLRDFKRVIHLYPAYRTVRR
jgi:hypothetical protein